MKTVYLKNIDKAIMQQDLLAAGLCKEIESDGVKTIVVSNASDVMVDVGVILKPTGKIISENGFNIPEPFCLLRFGMSCTKTLHL